MKKMIRPPWIDVKNMDSQTPFDTFFKGYRIMTGCRRMPRNAPLSTSVGTTEKEEKEKK
jgi:hypothetical protein